MHVETNFYIALSNWFDGKRDQIGLYVNASICCTFCVAMLV